MLPLAKSLWWLVNQTAPPCFGFCTFSWATGEESYTSKHLQAWKEIMTSTDELCVCTLLPRLTPSLHSHATKGNLTWKPQIKCTSLVFWSFKNQNSPLETAVFHRCSENLAQFGFQLQ